MERIDIDGPDTAFHIDQRLYYRGELFTGEAVEYFKDGRVWALTTYTGGLTDGPSKEWYPDGTLQMEGVCVYGVGAVGEWREWFPNGRLKQLDVFDQKGHHELRRVWNEDGKLIKETPSRPPYVPER